jgi:hypothetical protein
MLGTKALLALAVVGPIGLAGASLRTGSHTPALAQTPTPIYSQPTGWTAFDAEVSSSGPKKPSITGDYHRAADGSFRETLYFADEHKLIVAHIVNVQMKKAWTLLGATQRWKTQPVDSTGYSAPGLLGEPNDPGRRLLPDPAFPGLTLFEHHMSDGGVELIAPGLNSFPVRMSTADGSVRELSHIQIRPQRSELFLPPTDVKTFEEDNRVFRLVEIGQ